METRSASYATDGGGETRAELTAPAGSGTVLNSTPLETSQSLTLGMPRSSDTDRRSPFAVG
jgi:hypothetical protein